MKQYSNFDRTMEASDHFKKEARATSPLKRINFTILLIVLFLPTIVQAQFTEQIDSIKFQGITNDSLAFIVHSTICGGVSSFDGIEYLEIENNNVKVNIRYTDDELDCYCPWQTIIKIKEYIYVKAFIEVMVRSNNSGTSDYRSIGIKEIDMSNVSIVKNIIHSKQNGIFPNPVQNMFYIDLEEDQSGSLEIYDIHGSLLLNKNVVAKEKIDVSFLCSGLYIIIVDRKYIYKIIKQ